MSKVAKRLGRGLDSLISNLRAEPGEPADQTSVHERQAAIATRPVEPSISGETRRSDIVSIDFLGPNPFQPRKDLDQAEIASLADSIKKHGILQPIAVRRIGDRYQIIAGERRWRAAKQAGLTNVPVVLREANDQQMLELALVENLQREDLNAIDRAKAYRQFCDQFGLSAEQVGERVGEDRTTVTNYLRLLELERDLQDLVAGGQLGMGHARCLLGLVDPIARRELAKQTLAQQLSVRALEELVRQHGSGRVSTAKPPSAKLRPAHFKELETKFEQAVKTKVIIHEGRRKGSGRIVIEYYSLDDFDRVASLLGVRIE